MAVKTRAVSVTSTATRLDTADETDRTSGSSFAFYNNGTATIYMGGSDVTTSNGVPVAVGTWSPAMLLAESEAVYGRVVSGTHEARVLEGGI